jgi:hypothetical protein
MRGGIVGSGPEQDAGVHIRPRRKVEDDRHRGGSGFCLETLRRKGEFDLEAKKIERKLPFGKKNGEVLEHERG